MAMALASCGRLRVVLAMFVTAQAAAAAALASQAEACAAKGGQCDSRTGVAREQLLLQVPHARGAIERAQEQRSAATSNCTSLDPCHTETTTPAGEPGDGEATPAPTVAPQACTDAQVQRRRRNSQMCSCRRRSNFADNGWRCKDDKLVPVSPVWADEFDDVNGDGTLNQSKWNYYLGPNHHNQEKQYYTDRTDNAHVKDGNLRIVGKCERFGNMRYTSAYIKTHNKGDWGPGHRIEVKAKLPWGRGSWPAIWMLPSDNVYGRWPYGGEIDIMEAVGCTPGTVYGTVHTGSYNHMKGTQKFGKAYLDYTKWHTYSIDWFDTHMKWYVDDLHYHTFAPDINHKGKWPFDQRFFLILNVAIGGTWGGFCASWPSCSRTSQLKYEQVMEVDYVRVYCLDGSTSCYTPKYSCCSKCAGRAACSPKSGSCYDFKAKDYYESCGTSAALQESESVQTESAEESTSAALQESESVQTESAEESTEFAEES